MSPAPRPRVLLLAPPGPRVFIRDNYCSFSSKADYYWPPIDLVVQSGLLAASADVSVVDATAERLAPQEALDRCTALRPDFTLFVTGTASLHSDMEFVTELKQRTGTKLFGSGGNLTFWAERMMDSHPALDGILLEFISGSLARLAGGGEGDELEAVVLREAGGVRRYPAKRRKSFTCGLPAHALFPLTRYKVPQVRRRPFARTLTSFGCSYQCDFCIEGSFPMAFRDLDELFHELESLKELGIPEIYFMDNVLTAYRERFLSICRELQRHGCFSWFGQSRADNLDEEVARAAKEAGCHMLMIGVESGSDELLQAHRKGHGTDRARKAFEILKAQGIDSLAYFILGLPGETRESMQASLDLALSLPCDYVSFTIATPDPGTPMRDAAIAAGDLDAAATEFDCSKGSPLRVFGLSQEEIEVFQIHAHRAFYLRPRHLLRQLASVRGPRDLISKCATALSLLS